MEERDQPVEAHWLNESMSNKDVKEGNVRSLSFNCPVLVEAMNWLASQLSVLYGEANGKFFAINMLKHCVLNDASSVLLFSSEKEKIRFIKERKEKDQTAEVAVATKFAALPWRLGRESVVAALNFFSPLNSFFSVFLLLNSTSSIGR
ncbi:hypothetical protein IFM89_013538 [Coptis chinensis]|uniref:Uncharacterized protein n=1 Tax=Coptis chinensis TaxID=261450 RepID=A0A835LZD5_9MAGN|nr:hypothetical protein IFM89_013538 [Coptis chinensis]